MRIGALLLVAACGRVGFERRVGADETLDTPSDQVTFGPWGAPQALTALNSISDDSDPEISADGLELVFHSNRAGGVGGYDLYRSLRTGTADTFPAPTLLSTINTAGDELGPSLSEDGLTILYSNGSDIVFATRATTSASFTTPTVVAALSSADVDTTPELSGDGLVVMVTRGTVSTRDIWIYTRAVDGPPDSGWSAGTKLAELATPVTDCSPDLDRQGLTVYFHSDRLGTTDDIFVAKRAATSQPFDSPTIVDVVSSPMDEGDPTLTADLRTMVFHRALDLQMSTR